VTISDPKLPLATDSPDLEELDSASGRRVPSTSSPAVVRRRSAAHIWLRRLGVLLFVFLCATVGVMLIMLPWRTEWTENHLLTAYPALQAIFSSGFVRGLCTGLGFLNIWIGFQEALRYRED
jgi:Na+/phosphate symporter